MTTLFPFVPNWRDSYKVTYEFKTDVLTSRSGKEQRRALRNTPRKTVEFTATFAGARLLAFDRLMVSQQNQKMLLPEIPRAAKVTTGMPISGSTVQVDSVPAWLVEDATVILTVRQQVAVRTVDSVVGSTVTFTTASAEAWPSGTLLCPPLIGMVSGDLSSHFKTSGTQETDFMFNVDPASENPDEGSVGALTLDGYEVFPFRPNWVSDVDVNFQHATESVDYGFGPTTIYRPIPFATRIKQPTFVGKTAAEIALIRQFFARMKGQQGEFYASTEQADLTLAATTASGSNTLTVPGTDTHDAFAADTVFKALLVEMTNGTKYPRAITGIGTSGGNSIITIEGTAPVDWTANSVRQISWLPRSRFASDELTIEYLTESVAQTKVSIQTIEALA